MAAIRLKWRVLSTSNRTETTRATRSTGFAGPVNIEAVHRHYPPVHQESLGFASCCVPRFTLVHFTSARLLLVGVCCAWQVLAQDPFEIHVYEYEPMPWGEYSLEAHLNFMPQGD